MSAALFDLWEPVYWDCTEFRIACDAGRWDEWRKANPRRCRDCGALISSRPRKLWCGGADKRGGYDLCDDCATLEGTWGRPATDAERAKLADEQERRRRRYLREVAA